MESLTRFGAWVFRGLLDYLFDLKRRQLIFDLEPLDLRSYEIVLLICNYIKD